MYKYLFKFSLALLSVFFLVSSCSEEIKPEAITLEVTPDNLEFDQGGGEEDIYVQTNMLWTSSTDAEWISLSQTTSNESGTLTIDVSPNFTTASRTATVSIIANGQSREVQVQQMGAQIANGIPPDPTGMRDINSVEMARELKVGWNLGWYLEDTRGEINWSPQINQTFIDSVKAAGFNAVRIPVAWNKFSDARIFIIDEAWMESVEEVVNHVLNSDMYVIINIQWDEGWVHPTFAEQEYVTNRLNALWRQIAVRFRDYDDKLLFAGLNQVMWSGNSTVENFTVQNKYNQAFVNTVRDTGGRNAYRHLVVQGYNTSIDHTINYAKMPEDTVEDKLMMEVHFFDPSNFTLQHNSNITQWGKDASNITLTERWANESHVDRQFKKMKTNFVDKGVGVILGEYGAISRLDVDGHDTFREYYIRYVTKSAYNHGLVSFYWDNGRIENNGFAIFNRRTGTVLFPNILSAIMDSID